MKKHILRIRKTDKIVFDSIKTGEKTIETRAATNKLIGIKKGDILVFICSNNRLEKKVKKVKLFKDVNDILKSIGFRKIMPFINSKKEAKEVYYSFPNYKEKIKKYGIISYWI